MNEKDLIDFANWLWDIGRLKVKTQTPPFEDAEYWAKQYIKVRKLNIPVVMHWVSVVDELPTKNEIVIGYFPRGDESGAKVATAITYDGKKLRSDFPNSTAHCFEATYWMPLPKPPCA